MRVLHVIPSLLPESGGPGRSVPELCRALEASGAQVTLLSNHIPGKGITIDPKHEPYDVALIPGGNGSLAGARKIHRAIIDRASEFDLIHLHSLWNLTVTFAAAAALRVGLPYVLAPRGMLSNACLRQSSYPLKRAYSWGYDHRTVEGASRLHFLNADEERASQNKWLRNPPHFIARNGVDLHLKNIQPGQFRARFPELQDRRIMLFLGRLHAIKGLSLQLRALEVLVQKYPGLMWVLVGPDDGEWKTLEASIRGAGLAANVRWAGPLMGNERFSAIVDADVMLQTSLYECQSMTVNESLALGVPLVVTDSINYSEVQNAGAGFVVKRDPRELARAIESVFESPDRGNAMREAGRRFAAKELSWPTIARVVTAAYEEVLSPKGKHVEVSKEWRESLPSARVKSA